VRIKLSAFGASFRPVTFQDRFLKITVSPTCQRSVNDPSELQICSRVSGR